jgi:predicted flap endonuclease-1-like 5' DNA nuclease
MSVLGETAVSTWEIAMPSLLETTLEPAASSSARLQQPPQGEHKQPTRRRSQHHAAGAVVLHISKLRGITDPVRSRLKRQGITYTDQLVEAAGPFSERRALAARSGIEAATLGRLVCRADLTRIKGIGAIFADMLEMLGVDRTARLARREPRELHRALSQFNATERLARRAPTPEEVQDWIAQARTLPRLIDDEARSD